jgi:type I restriction enzyme, R subunit
MKTNFIFLQEEFSEMYDAAHRAEQYVYTDPVSCAIHCRRGLEQFVKWLYENDPDLQKPVDTTLNSLLHEPSFQNLLPSSLFRQVNLLRKLGNVAAHTTKNISEREALAIVKILHDFGLWVVRLYSRTQTPVHTFDETLIPTERIVAMKFQKHEKPEVAEGVVNYSLAAVEPSVQLQETHSLLYKDIKEANLQKLEVKQPAASLTEAETRKIYIDAMLKEAGWDLTQQNVIEFELQHVNDPESSRYADYVLWGDNGKPLGVVEAKKTLVDAYKGKRQAEVYADCLEKMFGQRPVIFFTNGYETFIWDDRFYPYRQVEGFYSKDELELLINRRTLRKPLSSHPVNADIADRYYQAEAIKRVAEDIEAGRRGALLVMATGSGKTRTAAAIVELFTSCNWAKRILFLADRNALVTQAKNAFNTHLPNLTSINLTKEEADTSSRIIFSTYPTMMNRIDNTKVEGRRYFGIGHFDVVIIDEAHRSIYQKYKALFQYFDALFIGLTATPKAETHKDTYELFGREMHNPTYAYELDKAVNDGYLTPPKAIPVPMKFPREGIKYDDLSEEEKEEYEKEFLENFGAVPDEVSSTAINTWLFNEDTVNKVLQLLMDKGLSIEGGDKLGKTIIFAKNHEHAVFIEKCFDKLYPKYAGKMLKVIDNFSYDAQSMIYEFSDPDKTEFQIAVSVDMLDTGIDIPEILNLVVFKPVRSKAKWWQMIGRGTRLRKDLFGPALDKEHFYLFDICGNIEFFKSNIKETEPGLHGTLSEQIFKAKLNLAFLLQRNASNEHDKKLHHELVSELHSIIAAFSPDDFRVKMKMQWVDKYKDIQQWNALSQLEVLEIEQHLAPLYSDENSNEPARRFDLMMLNCMTAKLEQMPREQLYRMQVQDTLRGLLKKMGIPAVKAKESLIKYVLEDEFWQTADVSGVNATRLELRDLIQYIDPSRRKNLYTNFEDEIGEIEVQEMIATYQELGSYKRRVEKFIRENKSHITIHRICNNQPITKEELNELEKLLFSIDTSITKEAFDNVVGRQPLAKFVRSILGLDVNAAKEAFAIFLQTEKLNATQLHFINTIIDYLTLNGTIDKKMLFSKPFTDINDQGLAGVFDMDRAGAIVRIIDGINGNVVEVG